MALAVLCLTAAACNKTDARASDPNTPAVVKAPAVVLPTDTVKKPVTPVVSNENAKLTLARNYAVLGAAASFADRRTISALYGPTATLTIPGGTFKGQLEILHAYSQLPGLKSFRRVSLVTTVVDSTVSDSGAYAMLLRRAGGADSAVDRGSYAATWRITPAAHEWFIMSDHLYSEPKKAARKK